MGANLILQSRMDQLGFTQENLATRLNDALEAITGRPGEISSRTVRNLLNGSSRRPIGRTCVALEHVFGCRVADLGLSAPSTMQEDPVRRRTFIASTAVSAAAVVPVGRQRRFVGMSDVDRLSAGMNELIERDDRQGGHTSLAPAALTGREEVLELQRQNASERVRRALYSLASEYTNIAAYSCIDLRDLDAAQGYLHEAGTFAGLSQNPETAMRVWMNMSMLAYQKRNLADQLAAAQAAQTSAAARRDPFYSSMGRARVALAQASIGDVKAARRSLGSAQNAIRKTHDSGERARWTAFYGTAELDHLAAIIHNYNKEPAIAEAMAHRALAKIPAEFQRNRALATCQAALAQLHQGDPEHATATAATVFTIMDGAPLPGRMRTLIGDFHRDLLQLAPSTTYARDWADRMREEWSRA